MLYSFTMLQTKQGFKQLFMTYYNVLCNYAKSFVSDSELAKDVVQEVFMNLWKKRHDIDESRDLKSYLFTSTRNKSIELLRKNKRIQSLANTLEQDSTEIVQEIDEFTLKEKMFASIRQLPPKCRQVLLLSKQNGLTYTEIAEELNISVKTVENHMGKALKQLRQMLNPEGK